VRLGASARPVLFVVVDTEEEFDWSQPFERRNTSVKHMLAIDALQRVFDESGVRPVYVCDYPIATQRESVDALGAILRAGRCEIGAHLHPWVSPPHDEEVNARNSYPGNLPRELERAKLAALTTALETNFGVRPRCYKAGRYGFGPHTAQSLVELGYRVDLSPCPPFDLGADGGPDWSAHPVEPYWEGERRELLVVPTTGAYVGFARGLGHPFYRITTSSALRSARVPGILSRLGAFERLHLSPEGYLGEHHRRITRTLLASGVRTFTFALHSPSVLPGCTPYVRTESDLAAFLDACRRYFEFFLGELGGVTMTPLEFRATLDTPRTQSLATTTERN